MSQERNVRRRVRRSDEQKHALVSAWEKSGQSARAFAKQEGLRSTCLWRWKRSVSAEMSASSTASKKAAKAKASITFAPVHVAQSERTTTGGVERVIAEVAVGRDVRVRVFDGSNVLRSALVSFDDSPLPAKVAGHGHGTQRGRLWMYIGDVSRVAYCEFTPDWKGTHPRGVLDGFSGHLQSDGYGGIAALFAGGDAPNKVGCNDHCRRKYVDAMKLGDRRATRVVALYAELYAIERDAKGLSADERLRLRRTRSVPVWAELSAEIGKLDGVAEPKSPLGKANTYFRRQHAALSAFLDNGILPISNAHVERLLRSVALFRKNSLFVGSLEAGERYAALLTLAVNCTLVGANPFAYFNDVFGRLAAGWPNSRAADLMPQAWSAAQQNAEQVENEAGVSADHD